MPPASAFAADGDAIPSYLGRYDGRNLLPFWIAIAVLGAFSLTIFALAVSLRLHPSQTRRYIENLDPMFEEAELDAADRNLTRAAS